MNKRLINKIDIKCEQCSETFKSWKSRKRKFCSYECYYNSLKGKKVIKYISKKERECRRKRMIGKNNPMWCGGDSDSDRRNSAYINWRIEVFKRDDFTCQTCGYRNGNGTKRRDLHAHHIVKWVNSIELRYVIENGKTLCVPCHIKEHTNKH